MPKIETPSAYDLELERHCRRLGCSGAAQYRAWCERHGVRFGGRKSRSEWET